MSQTDSIQTMLQTLKDKATEADVFDATTIDEGGQVLACTPRDAGGEATYQAFMDSGTWFVALVTPDRWLSESVESDLMHLGDSIEELIEEELIELGLDSITPKVEHFRSEELLYTFRTPLPAETSVEEAAIWLLAYEAAFRELGDMTAEPDE